MSNTIGWRPTILPQTFGAVDATPTARSPSTYAVQPGDSLFLIGRRFGVSAQALAQANGLHVSDYIYPGQVLKLPGAVDTRQHTVQPGDSLFLIGRRFGVSAEAIATANRIPLNGILMPGQVLLIPGATTPPAAPATPSGPTGTGLSDAADANLGFAALWPYIQRYAAQYGANPRVLAGIVGQESTFKNHRVHRDGTGHGLIGLDDNGMLPAFERWSGLRIGRGHNARTIPPELQLEFLAKTIGELTRKHDGNSFAAAREWHVGVPSRIWGAAGTRYERLIRQQINGLF